jgi:hypothetical protein
MHCGCQPQQCLPAVGVYVPSCHHMPYNPNTCGHSPTLNKTLEFSGQPADSKPGCMAVRSSKRHPGDLLICDSWSTLVPQFGLLTRQNMRATRPQCGSKQAPSGPEKLPGSLTLDSCSIHQHMCLAACSPHKSAHSPYDYHHRMHPLVAAHISCGAGVHCKCA